MDTVLSTISSCSTLAPPSSFILALEVFTLLPISPYFFHPQPLATTFQLCFYEFNFFFFSHIIHDIWLILLSKATFKVRFKGWWKVQGRTGAWPRSRLRLESCPSQCGHHQLILPWQLISSWKMVGLGLALWMRGQNLHSPGLAFHCSSRISTPTK